MARKKLEASQSDSDESVVVEETVTHLHGATPRVRALAHISRSAGNVRAGIEFHPQDDVEYRSLLSSGAVEPV